MPIERPLPIVPDSEEIEVEIESEEPFIPQGIMVEGEEEQPRIEIVPDDPSSFHENLAEVLDDRELRNLALELISDFEDDETSREDWMRIFTEGLGLLGIKTEDRTEPFEGASGVHHPLLSESVAQFQAQAYRELLPAEGPVKTQVLGEETPEKLQQAERVQQFMNYELTYGMEEYDPELDQMLFYLPLSGSAFKKVYYDPAKGRPVSSFIMADDFIVSYSTQDLVNCPRATHILNMTDNQIRKMQIAGMYRDIDIGSPTDVYDDDSGEVQEKIDRLIGVSKPSNSDSYTVLELHVEIDLEGFEDTREGEPTGIALPYIVTIVKENAQILAIRRNWNPEDPLKQKVQYFVHYKFLPGLGFYGFGLIHMIGGLSKSATSILRQLIDAGTLANLPAGFKARGLRIRDDDEPLQPGEWRDVDVPGGALRDALLPLPYKEPSGVLSNLLGVLVDSGQRFANIADMKVSDMNQDAPVGTTLALLERGSKIMSAIHKRLHYAQKIEFKLLARVFSETLPSEYPYDVVGANRQIYAQDFDDRIDVLPVSDPNIFSMSQRVMMAQTQLQLAQSAPQLHNMREAFRNMYTALGVQHIDNLLVPEEEAAPKNPVDENQDAMTSRPLKAFIEQNHDAHIQAHMAFLQNPNTQQNPEAGPALQAHVQEHQALKYRIQIEQMLTEQGVQLPQPGPDGKLPQLPPEAESQIAMAAAQATQEITGQEQALIEAQQIAQQQPQMELAQKQLELQEQEIQRKAQADQLKSETDLEKAQIEAEVDVFKAEKNEDIAQQRIAANREKDAVDAQLKSQKSYADILKQIKDAEEKSE